MMIFIVIMMIMMRMMMMHMMMLVMMMMMMMLMMMPKMIVTLHYPLLLCFLTAHNSLLPLKNLINVHPQNNLSRSSQPSKNNPSQKPVTNCDNSQPVTILCGSADGHLSPLVRPAGTAFGQKCARARHKCACAPPARCALVWSPLFWFGLDWIRLVR